MPLQRMGEHSPYLKSLALQRYKLFFYALKKLV